MATNYDAIYRDSRHALGKPTQAFVEFFEAYERKHARILDIGCGQGRDALFIARLGHDVVGVDLSESGIRDLAQDAKNEALKVEAIVADICDFKPKGVFDVIVIDRTLHMLAESDSQRVLCQLLDHTLPDGFILIADERKNIPLFEAIFDASGSQWARIRNDKGFLFVQRAVNALS